MTTRADHFQSVARAHSVPVSVFRAADKRDVVVAARRELIHRLCVVSWAEAIMAGVDPKRAKELHSLPRVGMWVNKDHTTCLYALRTYSAAEFGTGPKAKLSEMRDAYLNSLQAEQVAA